MKKIFLIAVIVVVGITWNALRNKTPENTEAPNESQSVGAILIALTQPVSYAASEQATLTKVVQQITVTQGAVVETGVGGRARITYPNGTITVVDESTRIVLTTLSADGGTSLIDLISGGMWSKVRTALSGDDAYDVRTETTVASVRGTIFGTEYKNKKAHITGIEGKVKAKALNPKTKEEVNDTETDINPGETVDVDADSLPQPKQKLLKRTLATADFKKPFVQNMMLDIELEDIKNPDNTQLREFMRDAIEKRIDDPAFKQKMQNRPVLQRIIQQIQSPLPSRLPATQSPLASPRPSASSSPLTKPTTLVTPTALSTPLNSPALVASATPTPEALPPVLRSVLPKIVRPGEQFALNGERFTEGRNLSAIAEVMVGTAGVPFSTIDSFTLFVTTPELAPGTYTIFVRAKNGLKAQLPDALTISPLN